jgi:hypothetical protein
MANFKKRRHIGRRSCRMCRPWKLCGTRPDAKFSIAELRKLGGRARRIRRRDVDWAFGDEAD